MLASPVTCCPLGRRGWLTPLEERERRVTFARMKGRPFGFDSAGRPAAQVSGKLIRGAVEALERCAAARAVAALPAGAPEEERARVAGEARRAAVDTLVARLNETILDPAYHVTAEGLRREGARYSRELELFANVFSQELSQEPGFYWQRGALGIPASLAAIMSPFPVRRVYELVPQLTGRFVDTDIRLVEARETSAVLQWYGHRQQEGLPAELRTEWLEMSCPAFCGAFASIPQKTRGLAPAEVTALRCQRQGSDCCEWRFRWQAAEPRTAPLLAGGVAASAALGAAAVLWQEARPVLAPAVLVPALVGWHLARTRALRHEAGRQDEVLAELQKVADELSTRLDATEARHQGEELEGARRAARLAAVVRTTGLSTSASSADELLRVALATLTREGLADRALVLLLDAERQTLQGGPSVGGSPEATARVRALRLSPAGDGAELHGLLGEPPGVLSAERLRDGPLGGFWLTLATRELVSLPLRGAGETLGLMLVDNTSTGRPMTEDDRVSLAAVAELLGTGLERLRRARSDAERTHPGR